MNPSDVYGCTDKGGMCICGHIPLRVSCISFDRCGHIDAICTNCSRYISCSAKYFQKCFKLVKIRRFNNWKLKGE